jgi:hypothetical protein
MLKVLCVFVLCVITVATANPIGFDDFEHPEIDFSSNFNREKRELPSLHFEPSNLERDPHFWNNKAENTLKNQLNKNRLNKRMAKNVIYFLGDGMGISTLMAARAYKGNEAEELSFEKFPYSGLSKTYCVNTQGKFEVLCTSFDWAKCFVSRLNSLQIY